MKKLLLIMLPCIVMSMLLPSQSVSADIGSKPSVVLEFDGFSEQNYYVTLLSKEKSTGPFRYFENGLEEGSPVIDPEEEEELEIWKAFYNYKDQNDFYFINYFKKVQEDNTFTWGYRPPTIFKVLIYYPDTDSYAVSGIYDWYAFDNYFRVTMNEQNNLILTKNYNYTWEIISLIVRIVATIGLEMLILLCFDDYNKKVFRLVFITNIMTQVLLNLLLNITNFYQDSISVMIQFILMEMVVILIEVVLYSWYFHKNGRSRKIAITYGFTANIFSFIVGLLLANWIPGIF